ncbi:MAG TPA: permease, partial [Armatimonadota bacterium]|nr:permease [Armatimonadota bacterium]
LLMALIWGRKDRVRQAEAVLQYAPSAGGPRRLPLVFAFLLALMIYGGIEMPTLPKVVGMVALALGLALTAAKSMDRDELMSWLRETGLLVKLVVPVLVPAVLIIGAIAYYTPILFIDKYLGYRNPFATVYSAVFGSLMYFPILTEVAFVKAFLKNHMDVGPAFALLLTGSGLSLPGMILIGRAMGAGRVVTYVLIVLALVLVTSAIFAQSIGAYICPCQSGP